jgi:ubiquinone/menaquinone biosynthesis C-methylase UbiE
VFEHVRHPEELLAEIRRVLKEGGPFIGSISTLEPYHSYSYWNYTPYGWYVLLTDAGFVPQEFRPGIDGISLIRRSYLGRPEEARYWFKKSPVNEEIDQWGKENRKRPGLINYRKIMYCGHLFFYAKKKKRF